MGGNVSTAETVDGAAPALLRAVRVAAETGIFAAEMAALPPLASVELPRGAALPELLALLTARFPALGIDLLLRTGLADGLLPEVAALQRMPASGGRHKDVYRHTLLVVERTPPDPILRLAALLHDIGKPRTKVVEGGSVHFPGHAEVGAEMARRRLRRLDAPAELREAAVLLVGLHLRANSYEPDWTDSAVRRLDHDAGEQLGRLLALSRADVTSGRREAVERALRRVDLLEERIALVRAADVKPVCPLTGHDLMALFARPPGPWIGVVKGRLEELVAADALGVADREGAITLARAIVQGLDDEAAEAPA